MSDVVYNFTKRKPVRASEWALWWFGTTDPAVAHTLGRSLFWSECVLWRDQIENLIKKHKMRFTASLSSEDLIVNTRSVRDYLVEADLSKPVTVESSDLENDIDQNPDGKGKVVVKTEQWRGVGLEILWWTGHDHSEALDKQQDRAKLVKVLAEYCSGT